jgi:hypothetical protein
MASRGRVTELPRAPLARSHRAPPPAALAQICSRGRVPGTGSFSAQQAPAVNTPMPLSAVRRCALAPRICLSASSMTDWHEGPQSTQRPPRFFPSLEFCTEARRCGGCSRRPDLIMARDFRGPGGACSRGAPRAPSPLEGPLEMSLYRWSLDKCRGLVLPFLGCEWRI